SFAGVLRHKLQVICNENPEQFEYFWGAVNQSAMILKDLVADDRAVITIRDGVKIDSENGTAMDEAKYNYEVVEPGTIFNLCMEVNLRTAYDKGYFMKTIATILDLVGSGKISVGAMTTKGFGRIRLEDARIYEFDFSQKTHAILWLTQNFRKLEPLKRETIDSFDIPLDSTLTIDAWFDIKSSLIIGAYSENPEDAADKTHIKSNNQPVLTGTALKGIIRSRAEKIINTLGGNGEETLKDLMGWVDTDSKGDNIKSRVVVEESEIKGVAEKIQHRIRIDRFTGGVISGALFDSRPLWKQKGQAKTVNMKITVNVPKLWEIGLLLLVLKDLWTEDLPVGGEKNIGRGVLQGIGAKIKFDAKEFEILQKGKDHLSIQGDVAELERFVEEFNRYIQHKETENAVATV
ncbi:MAG TPA: hypothetical protein ENH24_04510, partial [Nitrospirae bacterium]|nr:hypothetical protein [Nitrospirota bacterium]